MKKSMKAVIATNYGPPEVLELVDLSRPIPKDNEVLIKIYATTVTMGDSEMRRMKFPLWILPLMRIWIGPTKPTRVKVFGMELAGEIEEIGDSVTKFNIGDKIFASTGVGFGTYAEYKVLPEDGVIALKPENLTYEEAAAIPVGGGDTLHHLEKGNIQKGDRVLINGAGGTIGTFAVQLAKHYEAEVTAVDSTEKLSMLKSIGADHVIDYTKKDFTSTGETYDVIFDVIGKSPFSDSLKSLKQNGRYILANPGLGTMIRGALISIFGDKKVLFGAADPTSKDLALLGKLAAEGKLKSIIDKTFTLEEIVEAHRYVDAGGKKGHVAITVNNK